MLRSAHDNGMEVVSVARPSSPLVAVQLCLRVGSACEQRTEHGFAHLVQRLLLRAPFAAGYRVDATTTRDVTVFGTTVLRADAVAAAVALARTVFTLDVDEAALRAELAVLAQERTERHNDPQWRLQEALLSRLWQNTSYAHPVLGDHDLLMRVTPEQLHRFHDTWYTPAGALVVLAGDTATFELAQQVGTALTRLCPGRSAMAPRPRLAVPSPAAVSATEPRGAFGVALAHHPRSESALARHDLARRVLGAVTGLSVHRVRVVGGGATWLAPPGRAVPGGQTGACVAPALGMTEQRLLEGGGVNLLGDARVLEIRRSERLTDVARRVAEDWVYDRREYDEDQRHRCLRRVTIGDIAAVVSELRFLCTQAHRAAPVRQEPPR